MSKIHCKFEYVDLCVADSFSPWYRCGMFKQILNNPFCNRQNFSTFYTSSGEWTELNPITCALSQRLREKKPFTAVMLSTNHRNLNNPSIWCIVSYVLSYFQISGTIEKLENRKRPKIKCWACGVVATHITFR